MKCAVAIAATLLLLGLEPEPLGAQTCPTNSFWTGGAGFYEEYPTAAIWSFGSNGYDLIAGTYRASVGGGGEAGSGLGLSVHDRYRIVGPASATPIPILVRLHATGLARGGMYTVPILGLICMGSSATIRLSSGATLDEVEVRSEPQPVCADRSIDEVLEIPLSQLPGEEFPVMVSFSLGSGDRVDVATDATISFEVPSGYSIASCQGYAGQVVPASTASWGRLKNVYR